MFLTLPTLPNDSIYLLTHKKIFSFSIHKHTMDVNSQVIPKSKMKNALAFRSKEKRKIALPSKDQRTTNLDHKARHEILEVGARG